MTLAIIGAGNVGSALGKTFAHRGEPVYFGVTDPDKYRDLPQTVPQSRVGTVEQAIEEANVVILAVPYRAALSVAASVPDWRGRILVDATNPVAPGLSGLTVGTTISGAEEIANAAHNARVVKAFNTTGADNMADPVYPGGQIFMPVCGDDAGAREQVMALVTLAGFDAVDVGPLAAARYLEPMAMVWIHMAIKQGFGRQFAFGRLNRAAQT